MFRTILFLISAAVVIIFLFPFLAVISLLGVNDDGKGRAPELITRMMRGFARYTLKIAGAKIECEGEENIPEEAALFVCNHQGDFDVAVAILCLGETRAIIAKKEVKILLSVAWYMKKFGCLFMDRKDARQSLDCINKAQKLLENGRGVVIFPEGTRSKSDRMGEFKPGALRCAVKAGAPIVPVAISGSYKVFEEHRKLTPATIKVSILPPVPTKDVGRGATSELAKDIERSIASELERIRES
jgi:1-acyl-sn-glycerol-3-phosphate acyltransferase